MNRNSGFGNATGHALSRHPLHWMGLCLILSACAFLPALEAPPVQPFSPHPDPASAPANASDSKRETNSEKDNAADTPKKEADRREKDTRKNSPAGSPVTSPSFIRLSDGMEYRGKVHLTTGAKLRCFNLETKKREDVDPAAIRRIDIRISRSEIKRHYRFREAGSNEKVLDGPGYVDREYEMKITLKNGRTIRADSLGQAIYVDSSGKRYKFILKKHQRGKPGQSDKEIVYVKTIVFHADPPVEKSLSTKPVQSAPKPPDSASCDKTEAKHAKKAENSNSASSEK